MASVLNWGTQILFHSLKVENKLVGATWAIDMFIDQIAIGDALKQVFNKFNRSFKIAFVIEKMIHS